MTVTDHPHYTCKIITLKVRHHKLQTILDAMLHYCKVVHHDRMQLFEHHFLSLAAKMCHELATKINTQNVPSKKRTLKMEFYKAHVLHLACNEYLKVLDDDHPHEKAIITNLNFELYKQIL